MSLLRDKSTAITASVIAILTALLVLGYWTTVYDRHQSASRAHAQAAANARRRYQEHLNRELYFRSHPAEYAAARARASIDLERATKMRRDIAAAAEHRRAEASSMLFATATWIGVAVLAILMLVGTIRLMRRAAEARSRREESQRVQAAWNRYEYDKAEYEEALRLVEVEPAIPFNKRSNEHVIFAGRAIRVFDVGSREVPLGPSVTKTSGGAVGALAGGLLLGPVGAIAGYAASKKTSVTPPARTYTTTITSSDAGILAVTTERVVFLGDKDVMEIANDVLVQATASRYEQFRVHHHGDAVYLQGEARFRYVGAPPNERFLLEKFQYFCLALNQHGYRTIPAPRLPTTPPRAAD